MLQAIETVPLTPSSLTVTTSSKGAASTRVLLRETR